MRSTPVVIPAERLSPVGGLGQLIDWAHRLLTEVITSESRLVDLTAGNGHDSLFLARHLGPGGQLLSFDVQQRAIDASEARLRQAGLVVSRVETPGSVTIPGCYLIHDGHQRLTSYLSGEINAAIGNLGYLPGGDKRLTTRATTTIEALRALFPRLAPGGRLALVLYSGHPGGAEECAAVEAECCGLPPAEFTVLQLRVGNRRQAPTLLVVERRAPEVVR